MMRNVGEEKEMKLLVIFWPGKLGISIAAYVDRELAVYNPRERPGALVQKR